MALNLTIKQGSENYTATIVEIKNIFPIEGADKIVRTNVEGNDVIISKDEKIGTKMIYFVSGTKLNPDFCKYNNLLTDKEQNNDKTKTGYISHKQFRVKAIKLKGVISDGILLPLLSLAPILGPGINLNRLEIGNTFTDIDNIPICEKYIVPVARSSNPGGKSPKIARFNRILENQFHFHNDTANLRKNMHKLNPNDIIGIHYKKHGTSAVFANIPVKRILSWYERLLIWLGVNISTTIYDIVYSSRTVIKNQYLNPESKVGYYGEDIWGVVAKEIEHLIPKNWTIYAEILGFTPNGNSIQKGYDYGCNSSIRNNEQSYVGKKVKKESGKPFKSTFLINTVKDVVINPNTNNKAFSFIEDESLVDCHQCISAINEHKFYVYKISVVNPDGQVIFLTDKQIEEWCEKVGLLYSDTFIYYGKANEIYSHLFDNYIQTYSDADLITYEESEEFPEHIDQFRIAFLKYLEKTYNEKDCYMCTNKVPEEGIVLRIEHLEEYEAYKLKSKRFILRESEAQENLETNLEDNQDE